MNNEFMSAIAGKREEGGRGGLELWVGPGRAGKFGSNYTWNNLDLDRVTAVPVTRTTPAADTCNADVCRLCDLGLERVGHFCSATAVEELAE